MKKLNIGCGLCVGKDWINIDGSWNAWFANHRNLARLFTPIIGTGWKKWSQGIIGLTVKRRLPFKPESIDAIYSSHFLEHISRQDCKYLLQACHDVLKHGGIFRVVVPDLEGQTRKYIKEIDKFSSFTSPLPANRYLKNLGIFRASSNKSDFMYRLYQNIFDHHTHFWMYDAISMSALLEKTGFGSIQRKTAWESNIPDIEQVERKGAIGPNGVGFCLECVKIGKGL